MYYFSILLSKPESTGAIEEERNRLTAIEIYLQRKSDGVGEPFTENYSRRSTLSFQSDSSFVAG